MDLFFSHVHALVVFVFRSKGMNVDVKSLSTYENGMNKAVLTALPAPLFSFIPWAPLSCLYTLLIHEGFPLVGQPYSRCLSTTLSLDPLPSLLFCSSSFHGSCITHLHQLNEPLKVTSQRKLTYFSLHLSCTAMWQRKLAIGSPFIDTIFT